MRGRRLDEKVSRVPLALQFLLENPQQGVEHTLISPAGMAATTPMPAMMRKHTGKHWLYKVRDYLIS